MAMTQQELVDMTPHALRRRGAAPTPRREPDARESAWGVVPASHAQRTRAIGRGNVAEFKQEWDDRMLRQGDPCCQLPRAGSPGPRGFPSGSG